MRSLEKIKKDIDESTKTRKKFQSRYPNFIYRIRFPKFKNLSPDARLEFNYPLTILTGQNGCGKSSILHALQGAPSNRSVGNFWFTTKLDPIQEGRGKPNCFIFEYYNKEAKKKVEVIKIRVKYDKKIDGRKRVNPDYWEPKRAAVEYCMEPPNIVDGKPEPGGLVSGRWQVPKINVEYIDFRSELSAFDQYFYFGEKPTSSVRYKTKQDRLRAWVKNRLSPLLTGKKTVVLSRGKKKLNKGPVKYLNDYEVKEISYILGKNYTECKMLEHECFGMLGVSVQFSVDDFSYTEAFAGSGEMAVAKVVHIVSNAPKESLILLDEPEVSLHPGAQKKLRDFLLEKCFEFGHQVVICSHSPAFVEGLPDKAIRVLTPQADGKYRVSDDVSVNDAFVHIGQTLDKSYQIIVEDSAAKRLVERALKTLGPEYESLFQVDFYPGGETSIYKDLVFYSRRNDDSVFVIFDGDIYKGTVPESPKIPDASIDDFIIEYTGQKPESLNFRFDGGADSDLPSKKSQIKREFLEFVRRQCFFLPRNTPEEIIWCASEIDDRKSYEGAVEEATGDYYKRVIGKYAQAQFDEENAKARELTAQNLLKTKLDESHEDFQKILEILREIKSRFSV
ncbi:MAG: ATP-binding protein [Pseudomonadota bacterium]|nr:ATP-binding protein [Pseudomonadota bacterium]